MVIVVHGDTYMYSQKYGHTIYNRVPVQRLVDCYMVPGNTYMNMYSYKYGPIKYTTVNRVPLPVLRSSHTLARQLKTSHFGGGKL